uniref:Uncharacterized protein n=1 Tax=Tanacetum cinerariifolium TaxID=118510 RepID=A0A6L2P8W2_TANCI|nr:hypothetical protein [Tanacetum cinerariifolium]
MPSGFGDTAHGFVGVKVWYCSDEVGCTGKSHGEESGFGEKIGRKSGARLSEGHFIGRLAAYFCLVGDQGLRGLSMVVSKFLVIDLHELARLNICSRFGNTWDWVASRPERQQAAATGAPGATEDAPSRIDRLEEEVRKLRQTVVGLQGVVKSFITEQTRVSIWMISCMTQLMDASNRTYQAFDNTLASNSRLSYERPVRPRTGDASTFAAPQTDDQPDP